MNMDLLFLKCIFLRKTQYSAPNPKMGQGGGTRREGWISQGVVSCPNRVERESKREMLHFSHRLH